MIIETSVPDHPNLVRRFSDQGFLIQNDQTGNKYKEAIDIIGLYTYTETNEKPEEDEISDSEALSIILGREYNEPDNSGTVPPED